MIAQIKCPTCGTQVEWRAENRFRPFCSERCKNIDLGAWSSGQYALPDAPESASDVESDPDLA